MDDIDKKKQRSIDVLQFGLVITGLLVLMALLTANVIFMPLAFGVWILSMSISNHMSDKVYAEEFGISKEEWVLQYTGSISAYKKKLRERVSAAIVFFILSFGCLFPLLDWDLFIEEFGLMIVSACMAVYALFFIILSLYNLVAYFRGRRLLSAVLSGEKPNPHVPLD